MLRLLSLLIYFTNGGLVHLKDVTLRKFDNVVYLSGPALKKVPSHMDVTDIGDLVARSFWAGKLKHNSQIKLDAASADANLLIVNFGLDSSHLEHIKLRGIKTKLDNQFFPADHVSLLTSIATGQNPTQHGVIGKSWKVDGALNEAYTESKPSTFSSKLTFSQVVQKQDPKHRIHTYSRDLKLGASLTQDVTKVLSLKLSQTALAHRLTTEPFWTSQKSHLDQLDLTNPDVEAFLTECEQARRAADSMLSGESPQFYNFAFTAAEKVTSPAALRILNSSLQYLKTSFDTQFPNGSSQIAFLKRPQLENPEAKLGETVEYVHPKEFGGCDHATCVNAVEFFATDAKVNNSQGGMDVEARVSQISAWLFFVGLMIVISFAYTFSNMNYQTDAILFTMWQRGTKPKGMGMRGF